MAVILFFCCDRRNVFVYCLQTNIMNCMARVSCEVRDDGVILVSSIKNTGCGSLHIEDQGIRQNLVSLDTRWTVKI